jgi:CelD/BcsL family acetyltransferase involved in cellulose biosynthesis
VVDHAEGTSLMDALTLRIHRSVRDAAADLETPGLAGYAFARHAWLQAWADTFGAQAAIEPAIVVVADARIRMVLPLGVVRRNGLRTLEFLGGIVTDYNAPSLDPDFARRLDAAAIQVLWRRIAAALPPHDTIRLTRMPATLDPPEGAGGERVPNPLALLPGVQAAGQARSVTIPESYGTLTAALRPRFWTDTQRCHRRLAEVGPVALAVADDDAALRALLVGLKRMKSRRWRETKAKDWFAVPAFSDFYEAMARIDLPEGRIHGSSLNVSGTAIAAHLGLVYRGRFYLLLCGWEAGGWRRFSTGRLMTETLLRRAFEDDLRVFDFTVGEEAYKDEWANTLLPLLRYETAVTARGRLAAVLATGRERLRTRAKQITWLRGMIRRLAGRPPLGPR